MTDEPENPHVYPMSAGDKVDASYQTNSNQGITLRDYFAGQAFTGIVNASADYATVNAMAIQIKGGALEAKAAYAWADAMLAERVKK